MISSSTPAGGEGILYCQSCSPKITIINPMAYQCTEFSTIEDWTSGENTVIFNYTLANLAMFYVGYTDCCWVSLQNGGSSVDVSVMTMISTTAINRTGVMRINNSPVTSFSPITRLIQNCNYTITIPG
ncbi:hypothetical protein FSP39_004451 [Pinctada imbricata]|uniref:Uncharacterized protein n=1 Tax=Pinctada imbricata TaxID=66713 RepID=A0AA88YKS8_PINIB|nr:hypothetical protein FSP39_004451 [Pinctada imbricata]